MSIKVNSSQKTLSCSCLYKGQHLRYDSRTSLDLWNFSCLGFKISSLFGCFRQNTQQSGWHGWQDFKRMCFGWAACRVCCCVLSVSVGCRERSNRLRSEKLEWFFYRNVSRLSFSDDRAEEAEAADRPFGTPSAHERQPPAARVRPADRAAQRWLHARMERALLTPRLHIMYTALSVTCNGRETL